MKDFKKSKTTAAVQQPSDGHRTRPQIKETRPTVHVSRPKAVCRAPERGKAKCEGPIVVKAAASRFPAVIAPRLEDAMSALSML